MTREVHETLKDKQGQEGRLVQKQNNMNKERLESSYIVSNNGINTIGFNNPPIHIPHTTCRSFNQHYSWNETVLAANKTNT